MATDESKRSYRTTMKPGETVRIGENIEVSFYKEKGDSGDVQIRAPLSIQIRKVMDKAGIETQ